MNIMNGVVGNMLAELSEQTQKTGARFTSLTYRNEHGEKSLYNLIFGINIISLYKADLRTLEKLQETLTGIDLVACQELIASIKNSLEKGIGNNDNYTLKGYYKPLTPNGEIKFHNDEKGGQYLYIRGYVLKKTVLEKGEYKHVNSSEKTLAKKKIEKQLKRGKIRSFKIDLNSLSRVKANGMTVEIS